MKNVLLSWSSGKDSAWTLHVLRQQPDLRVVGLLTTFNQAANRVAMHAVRRQLVEMQAAAAELPLWDIDLPWPCSNEQYEAIMRTACERAVAEKVDAIAFGDLFLEDVRDYRIRQLQGSGLEPLFPIWGIPTDALAQQMIAAGLRSRLTCIDPKKLDRSFAGREFDTQLLRDLPEEVDPCGERGEFHSFCYASPAFNAPIAIVSGEVVERDGFVFADVLPT